jgi:hypothetical protein
MRKRQRKLCLSWIPKLGQTVVVHPWCQTDRVTEEIRFVYAYPFHVPVPVDSVNKMEGNVFSFVKSPPIY